MSRRLAEDRCRNRGHRLAWVEMLDGEIVVLWRQPETRSRDGVLRRDLRSTSHWGRPADDVLDGVHAVLASCGCRDEHSLDLGDVVRRAKSGDTRPVLHGSVHATPKVVPAQPVQS